MEWSFENHQSQAFAGLIVPGAFSKRICLRLNSLQIWHACTQRLLRRRYMRPDHAASAMRGYSRQTDFTLPALRRVARFCHARDPLSVTGKQRFKTFRYGL
jgi:hypothetical protein